MVIKLSELPRKMRTRWEQLVPLLLTGEEIDVNMVARALGVNRSRTMEIIRKMRKVGLPVPKVSQKETVDYGYCPKCGDVPLSVALVNRRKAVRYCPDCGWDAEYGAGTPIPSKPTVSDYMTTQQAALMLNVSVSTVCRWIKIGRLSAVRRSKEAQKIPYYIPISEIEAIQGAQRHN